MTAAGLRRIVLGVVGAACAMMLLPGAASASIYWVTASGSIGRANVDGSGVNQTFITGASDREGWPWTASNIY